MPIGYLNLVLHAHLPYVRHPEYDDFLEEDWLYEAITETYIPLLEVGKLEGIPCGATHGFLPLMEPVNRQAARAQVEVGCREFERHFGERPQGIWLPECGYVPGVDELLRDAGIRYFFVGTHAIMF